MRRVARWLGGVVCLGALGAGIGVWWLGGAVAAFSGSISVRGPDQPLEIVRDAHAIPHIFAGSERDAYFGLGYVHAQDRLWQLELNRRMGSGRLSEVFGPDALERDRLFRTLGLRGVIEQNLARLDAQSRAALEAYVAGVNAFLDTSPTLPPEFLLLGLSPEPWTAVDALVWLKVMAWTLSGNYDSELWRWRLSRQLTPVRLAEFLAPYPGDEPIVLGSLPALHGSTERSTGVLELPENRHTAGLGSNNWVVDGTRSKSGKPLLANDPHLTLTAPAIWYLAHLHAPGLDVIGATLPGVPGVVLGRNHQVGWAFTNTGSDTQDLYLEKLAPGEAGRYLTPRGVEPFETRREVIRVKGEADALLDVRLSRHGPIVSDVDEDAASLLPQGHVLALAWTALRADDLTFQFILKASHAQTAAELHEAARDFHAPQQNIAYADTAGAIGFIAAGRVPERRADNELKGLLPAPGWLERYDWVGAIPFEQLPQEHDPAVGRIVTANQKITAPGYPHWITSEWAEPHRARRIEALLDASERHDVESFTRIQLDVQDGAAHALLPAMLGAMRVAPPLGEMASAVFERLRAWDGEMNAERVEPLVFAAWMRALTREIYADELGEQFEAAWGEPAVFLDNVLSDREGQSRWCDDIASPVVESCGECLRAAYDEALHYLVETYGQDWSDWSWGRAHVSRSRHFPMTRVPVLSRWFDVTLPSSGGSHTVNVGSYSVDDAEGPFVVRHAAAFRAIYDFADLERSVFLTNTGQSGHVLSSHYRDWARRFASGELAPMLTKRAAVEQGALGTLRLAPL